MTEAGLLQIAEIMAARVPVETRCGGCGAPIQAIEQDLGELVQRVGDELRISLACSRVCDPTFYQRLSMGPIPVLAQLDALALAQMFAAEIGAAAVVVAAGART